MGMFDYIICKYPLPDIDLTGTGITKEEVQSESFQTKCLENYLKEYTIEEDGRISYTHYNNKEWVEGDKNGESVLDRIGHMVYDNPETRYRAGDFEFSFYTGIYPEKGEYDCWFDFLAKVKDGKVSSIELTNFEKVNNTERKQRQAEHEAEAKARYEFCKTWQYKYFYWYVNKARYWLRRKLIALLHVAHNWVYKL